MEKKCKDWRRPNNEDEFEFSISNQDFYQIATQNLMKKRVIERGMGSTKMASMSSSVGLSASFFLLCLRSFSLRLFRDSSPSSPFCFFQLSVDTHTHTHRERERERERRVSVRIMISERRRFA